MPIKVKDHDKCKEWERRRRDRLNDAFKNLAQLLPHYDPAKIPPKIDILEKSTEFVKELRLSNSRLLSKQAENDEKCKLIKELQDEVNKLILRVKQLTILLRKANITIPTGPALKSLGSKRLKWSGKIKPEDVENSNVIPKLNQLSVEKPNPVVLSPVKDAVSATKDVENQNASNNNPLILPATIAVSETTTVSSTPSIIIPLKETNSSLLPSDKVKPVEPSSQASPLTTTSPTVTVSSVQSSPVSKTTTTTVISASLPTLLSEPIFTTTSTPLQLPLQTIFLTPCSLTSAQNPQLLTRFTLPAPILPRPLVGHSLQKIAIKQVLKPIPKVIRRRRKRTKKVVVESKEKCNTCATSNPANPIEIPTSTETTSENKVPEKASDDVVVAPPNLNESVQQNEGEIVTKDIPLPTTNNTLDKEASGDNEVASEVDEKGNEESKPEERDGKVEPVQNTILEETNRTSENEVVTSSSTSLPAASKINSEPEAGATGEEASSDSIPVLRIIDESQTNENSNIFSCVIVEDQQNEPEKISNENEAVPTVEEQPTVTAEEEVLQETLATTENDANNVVPLPEPKPAQNQTKEVIVEAVSTAEIQPVKDQNEGLEKEICMEQEEVETTGEAMETDTLKSKPIEIDNIESSNANLLPLQNSLEIETSSKIVNAGISENLTTVETIPHKPISTEDTLTKNSNSHAHKTFTSPSDSGLAQDRNQSNTDVAVASIATIPVLENGAPCSSSSMIIKSIDYTNTTNLVKQMSHHHHERESSVTNANDNVTTTDKISECIARSIDLIDANDSELMELGEHWEDTGGSPKSPISPTQMFLNIFPLLPRESSMNEQQPPPPTQTTPQKSSLPFPSSSSRSSFFIDAMLPDDHSVNHSTSISEDIEMISSSTSQSQCLALTPPQFSASIGHSISSSLSTSNTSYYWNTASCNVESSMDYRSSSYPPRSLITSAPTPITVTNTAPTLASTKSNAVNTPTSSTAATISYTTTTSASVTSKPTTSSESPRKTFKSKQNSTGLPSYASASKSKSSAAATSSSAPTSVTWAAVTPTPSHSFNVSNSNQQSTTAAVQSFTQLPSSSVSASGNQSHSHSCSLLDALNPMDASFFRPLINALDSHDFRALEFPPSTPLPPPPPPLPSLITSTKPLYTPQFSSTSQNVQNQMNVNYHHPITHDHHQHNAAIPSSIIHHHHHHSSMFSNTGEYAAAPPPSHHQDLGSSKKQHHVQHASTSQIHQPLSQLTPQIQSSQKESLASSKNNPSQQEKTSRTSSKQGKSESSRQSRSGKSSRTQPYIVPSSSSQPAAQAAPANHHKQLQAQAAFSSSSISHTPYHTNTSSSNTALKLASSASCSKNHNLFTPNPPSASSVIGIGTIHNPHQPQHYASNTSQHYSTPVPAPTVKVAEAKSQRSKHEDRSQATQNQPKSRIYQNLPQQAAAQQQQPQIPPSSQNVVSSQTQAIMVGNTASSSVAQTGNPNQTHHITLKTQQQHQNSGQAFQFHPPPADSFQLFPDFSGNMSRQFNVHTHQSVNLNLQSANNQSNAVGANGSNFATPRSHHPYYLPDISSFDNFTMPIPPTSQQIHSNTPSRQPAGGSSCNQTSKYNNMYGSGSGTNTNANQQAAVSSTANRMPQIQPQPVQVLATPPALHQQTSQRHHHVVPSYNHTPQHQSSSHTPQHQPSSHTPQQIIPHSQASQTVPPPVRQNQRQGLESCQQTPQRAQNQQAAASTTPSKAKQLQPVPSVNYPPPNSQQPHVHHLHQQHQTQHISSQSQQPQHGQTNRPSASRTVNWMTDTAYRTNSNTNISSGSNTSNKQCLQQSGPTNNPFSVSKLVGITPTPTAPVKPPHQPPNIEASNNRDQQHSSSSSNRSKPAVNPGTSSTSNNSNSQSNYCAEALIRKNPNPEWENFSSSANTNFSNYPTHPTSSSSSHGHSHSTDHFPNYSNLSGPYQYPGTSSSGHHSTSSHFSHFGGSQSQHTFHSSHHHHQHQQHQPPQSSSSYHSSQPQQPQPHTIHPHTHTQPNQIHYQHQHHPQQSHGTSTSSVSNFNLSTIFPEINDKRSGSNNTGAGQQPGASASNVGRTAGTGSGNMNSFNYHHPAFPGNAGNSHQ